MVTVFTPAYNSKKTIERLYNSLLSQTNSNFEWVVVNDGSTDDSDALLEDLISKAPFKTVYVRTENGGKYNAYNKGLQLAGGDYFICVDADDYLPEYAIEKITDTFCAISDTTDCCGIAALKEILGQGIETIAKFPTDGEILTLEKIEFEYKTAGEKTYVFKTALVKDILFPDILPEKFFPELYLYDEIASKYKFLTCNTVLTICEYQPDGYTGNYRKLMINNPTGFAYLYGMRALRAKNFKTRFAMFARYHAFAVMSHNSKCIRVRLGFAGIISFPIGMLMIIRYKFL